MPIVKMKQRYSEKRPLGHLFAVQNLPDEIDFDFERVFTRFSSYVASVALRLLGDDTAVDDVVQDVFLDCYRQFNCLQSMEHARRWLVKVTVRKAIRRIRRQKLARFLNLSDPGIPEPSVPLVTADERAQLIMLYALLERIPVKERMAWSLRYLEGAEISEVAYACGCSLATAKRRIRAAQQMIKGEDHDE
ncbi:MAG: sigma-70 family RNA polymerase sigma factor [Deltaproteobacteria bacterium]|nr:sigma-70 family RNA polymerase sigma factor [Deltaproteobacteria bacterium]